MTIKDFQVGQKAYMLDNDRRRPSNGRKPGFDNLVREAEVTKIGRKYVTLGQGGWTRQFREALTPSTFLVEQLDCGTPMYLFRTKQDAQEYLELKELQVWFASKGRNLIQNYAELATLKKVKELLEACQPNG